MGERRIRGREPRADRWCGPPFGENAPAGFADYAPTLGLASVYALVRAGENMLRPLIPDPLAIDTYDGLAWIGITPFTMWGVRPAFTPPLPSLSEFHELNVRTYVHLDGVPGVWFFSLDANNAVAALGARVAFHLPYFNARMSLERRDRTIYFSSRRAHRPPRGASRVRSRLDGRREVAPVRAGFAGVLPDRAVLSLFRPRRQALPSTDPTQALARARGAPAVVPFDDDRSSRADVT